LQKNFDRGAVLEILKSSQLKKQQLPGDSRIEFEKQFCEQRLNEDLQFI
jgi:hypothetical protein